MAESIYPHAPRGRGTSYNPANRFVGVAFHADPEDAPDRVPTEYFEDHARTVLTRNDSPDIPLGASLNPYRGCSHGCPYCFARPSHEYFDLGAGLDFETKIFVKRDAAKILREEISKPRYVPEPILISGVTDPYQPVEKELRITRQCLEVLAEFRHPVAVISKSAMIERDADLLAKLAKYRAAKAILSVTSLDADLQRALEPRASTPAARLRAIRTLSDAGVPVFVNVAPVIPGLTDHEIPAILKAAREAGAVGAGWILVRLPFVVKELFEAWLQEHVPTRKARVLHALRSMHGGKLYNSEFGKRMRGEGPKAEQIKRMFEIARARLGYEADPPALSVAAFRRRGQGEFDFG